MISDMRLNRDAKFFMRSVFSSPLSNCTGQFTLQEGGNYDDFEDVLAEQIFGKLLSGSGSLATIAKR